MPHAEGQVPGRGAGRNPDGHIFRAPCRRQAITAAAKSNLLRGDLVSCVHRPARHGAAAGSPPLRNGCTRARDVSVLAAVKVPPSRSFAPRERTSAARRGKLPRSRSPTASRWIFAAPARQTSILAEPNRVTLGLRRASAANLRAREAQPPLVGSSPRPERQTSTTGRRAATAGGLCRAERGQLPWRRAVPRRVWDFAATPRRSRGVPAAFPRRSHGAPAATSPRPRRDLAATSPRAAASSREQPWAATSSHEQPRALVRCTAALRKWSRGCGRP